MFMWLREECSGTGGNHPALHWAQQDAHTALCISSGLWTLRTSPDPNLGHTEPRLPPPTPHTTITHTNYTFNCCTLISPQPAITACSCKPNQGKPAYLHKSCNEKYNDFTNKTWIRTRICDKHFVSRRIENDFLS